MNPSKAVVARMGLDSDSLGAGVKGIERPGRMRQSPNSMGSERLDQWLATEAILPPRGLLENS